jgi:hypothetical protein
MAFPKFQTKEVLNKVLNSGEDALNVDLSDSVTVTVDSEFPAAAALQDDSGNPTTTSVGSHLLGYDSGNTNWNRVEVDDAGHLQIDVLSITAGDNNIGNVDIASALPSGSNTIGKVDLGTTDNAVLDAIDAVLDTIKIDTEAIETAVEAVNQAAEGTITSTTQRVTIATDDDGVAHLATIAGAVSTQMQVDVVAALPAGSNTIGKVDLGTTDNAVLDAIDAVLDTIKTDTGTIDSDTDAIKTATEASQASLADMIYGTAVAIDIDSGNHTSLTHNALYVGTGGNVKVNMGTSGTGITFSNVASGQILPIQITQVWQSGTTAEDMVALKE